MIEHLFLSPSNAAGIHQASLQVLENTGVKLDQEEAEALYLEAGAKKDGDGRILIPGSMVEEALEKAHSAINLFSRDGERSIQLINGNTYFGPGSDALYNIDKQSGKLRQSVLSDVTDNVRLADSLSGFDFIMSMALPQDVDHEKLYPVVFAEMVKNTEKPIVATLTSIEDMKRIHKIASIVSNGEKQLKEKPFFMAYLEPMSPLKMDRASTDRLLYCAEHDIPFIFAAGANSGAGAPITPEGGLVQGSAESLAGLVLALLKNENARFVFGANTSSLDMRSMIVCYGAPEWFKTVAMYADMGKYYKLPSWGTAGSSDSFFIDAQAAMEAHEGILLALQSGSTLVHDVGYLAHGELYDAGMLILTDIMINRVRHLLKSADLSGKGLAVDVIDGVARRDDLYLTHDHTAENFKDALWIPPKTIERGKIEKREQAQEMTLLLREEANRILSSHTPKELSADKLAQIDQFIGSL
jgi:trimethylamine--corrinoid protein Co-methyltransferase